MPKDKYRTPDYLLEGNSEGHRYLQGSPWDLPRDPAAMADWLERYTPTPIAPDLIKSRQEGLATLRGLPPASTRRTPAQ